MDGGHKYRAQMFTCSAAVDTKKKLYRKWFPPATGDLGTTDFEPTEADRTASATQAAAPGAYDSPASRAAPDSGAAGSDPDSVPAGGGGAASGGSGSTTSSKKSAAGARLSSSLFTVALCTFAFLLHIMRH